MKKPTVILLAVILVGIAAFFLVKPRASNPAQGKPVVIGFENDAPTFDPLRLNNIFALRVASQVFEGLTKLDESNRIVGGVAETWNHSPDFTTWTFRLRDGVKFHPNPALDGASRELTANDVVYSFTRMLSKDAVTAGPLASVLKGAKEYQEGKASEVAGLRVISQREVEFSLLRSDALFPGRISSPAYGIVKKAVVDASGANFGQTVAVGTGPFEFVERRGNELVLKAYRDYWGGGKDAPETVIFRTVKEDAVRLAEAKAGRLDVAYATPPMLEGLVERNGTSIRLKDSSSSTLALQSFPIFNTTFLAFNYQKVDPDLRRAIALAIDRDEIVAAVAPTSGIWAAGPIPLACAGYQTKVKAGRDLEGAKAALNAYREKNPGVSPKLRILAHELAQSVPISEIVQSQLKQIGIEVEIVQQSFNAVVGLLQKGDYEAVGGGFEYQYSSPQLMLENFFTSSAIPLPNVFNYNNPRNDAAIAALLTSGDEKASLEQASEVEKQLVADYPGVFLFQTHQVILLNPKLHGVQFNGANFPILTHASWK